MCPTKYNTASFFSHKNIFDSPEKHHGTEEMLYFTGTIRTEETYISALKGFALVSVT